MTVNMLLSWCVYITPPGALGTMESPVTSPVTHRALWYIPSDVNIPSWKRDIHFLCLLSIQYPHCLLKEEVRVNEKCTCDCCFELIRSMPFNKTIYLINIHSKYWGVRFSFKYEVVCWEPLKLEIDPMHGVKARTA